MLRTSLLVAAIALIAVTAPRESVAAPADRPLVQPGTPLRVVLLPVKLPQGQAPSRRRLERALRRLAGSMSRATYGRLRIEGQIAPLFRATRSDSRGTVLHVTEYKKVVRSAEARGIRFGGGIPILIAPSRRPLPSFGGTERMLIYGTGWDASHVLMHELGHALGLQHARGPSACPRPFRPLACADRPRNNFEYGDDFDVMGSGAVRFGAYPLAVLGFAPVLDAPPGRARLALRPLDGRQPTLLRLRAARQDWFVDTRIRAQVRYTRQTRPPRGVAISRAQPRYAPGEFGYNPTQRIPATDPGIVCRSSASCLGRQVFRPGRSFTVPGAFRLHVLRGRGPVRVETTWLDRTPPTVAVARTTVVRRFGTGTELVLDLLADARGAGVARVEIDHGGMVTRVDADDVPGLVAGRRGHGRVRVPLVAGAATRVWLVDAAGNASAPVPVDVAAAASVPAATVTSSPAFGSAPSTAVQLAAGQSVTVSATTDPALAGQFARFQPIGPAEEGTSHLPIGADGRFSVTWAPPIAGRYELELRVPVERLPDGINFKMQLWQGHFRG